MKNIWHLFNIHTSTYFLILSFLFTGYIKNIILIYVIVFFHELGHIFIIKLLGYKIIRVDIYPSGGITRIDKKINTKLSHDILIASFGLVFQILLTFLFTFFASLSYIRSSTYEMFLTYNTTIFVFNLLPIIPLDGYKLLRCIWEILFPYKKAFQISFVVSLISVLLFLTYHQIFSLNNYLIVTFLIYKMITEFKNFKYQNERFLLERYLHDFPYHKIKNEKKLDLALLKKDTYHYFKKDHTYVSEKRVLKNKYRRNDFETIRNNREAFSTLFQDRDEEITRK